MEVHFALPWLSLDLITLITASPSVLIVHGTQRSLSNKFGKKCVTYFFYTRLSRFLTVFYE